MDLLPFFVWNFGGMQGRMLYERRVMQVCVQRLKNLCVYHVVEYCSFHGRDEGTHVCLGNCEFGIIMWEFEQAPVRASEFP